jgi:cytochrome c-type biogenesis protein CcmH/NrfG
MAAWLIPAVKAILPYLSPIIAATMPVFSSRKGGEAAATQASLVQQQITELQTAASQNAIHVKELAEQLRNTVAALEQGAAIAEARLKRISRLCVAAIIVSVMALCVSGIVLFGR